MGQRLNKRLLAIVSTILFVVYLFVATFNYTIVGVNRIALDVAEPIFLSERSRSDLSIAFLSDLHVSSSHESLARLDELVSSVIAEAPDLVILGGDLVDGSVPDEELQELRHGVAVRLGRITDVPLLSVLGNHESWTNPVAWKRELNRFGVIVIDGHVEVFGLLGLCVRGFGDAYSGKFKHVEFPLNCSEMTKISVTHDPAGAFKPGVEGLVLAGHTHCGQIRFPLLGAPWVPSDAPPEAHCGLYEDSIRTVFVSSGVGTSLLPFRFGAQSQWDLISLTR